MQLLELGVMAAVPALTSRRGCLSTLVCGARPPLLPHTRDECLAALWTMQRTGTLSCEYTTSRGEQRRSSNCTDSLSPDIVVH